MPPARSSSAHAGRRTRPAARGERPARPVRTRPRVLAGGAAAIRWDRVSRVALLVVLLVLVYLYAGPARSYWDTVGEAKQRRAEVATLKRENARLRTRRDGLRSSSALEREARRLGMVKPGERPYLVEHLPKGP
jgi:cell division protein FtsB